MTEGASSPVDQGAQARTTSPSAMSAVEDSATLPEAGKRNSCAYCGARIWVLPGHSGRYRFTDTLRDTAILGSGSECPSNDRGHQPTEEPS